MLGPHADVLSTLDVVLASASPRRLDLLAGLLGAGGFRVVVSGFDEDLDPGSFATPDAYCLATAEAKARSVYASERRAAANGQGTTEGEAKGPDVVLGADTVVIHPDGRTVLEKPAGPEEAAAMLRALSGGDHYVFTGVVVLAAAAGGDAGDPRVVRIGRRTRVRFAALDEATVAAYVATDEPYDKAGGYGIQGAAGAFVEEIQGCYFNVVGLPVHLVATTFLDLLKDGTLVRKIYQ